MVPAGRAAAKKASAGREPVLPRQPRPHPNRGPARPGDFEWQSRRNGQRHLLEEMMSRFKQTSDEKMSDLKRAMSPPGYSRRGQQK